MSPADDLFAPVTAAIRRERARWVLLVVVGAALAGGLVFVFSLQHSTAGKVKIVTRNSRCNGGDLYACRVVAQHLREACSPGTLAKVPAAKRTRERRRCGALGLVAGVTNAARGVARRPSRRRSSGGQARRVAARSPHSPGAPAPKSSPKRVTTAPLRRRRPRPPSAAPAPPASTTPSVPQQSRPPSVRVPVLPSVCTPLIGVNCP